MELNFTESVKSEQKIESIIKINNLEIKKMKNLLDDKEKNNSSDSDDIIEFEKIDFIDPQIFKVPYSSTNRFLSENTDNSKYFSKSNRVIKDKKYEYMSLIYPVNKVLLLCRKCNIPVVNTESK